MLLLLRPPLRRGAAQTRRELHTRAEQFTQEILNGEIEEDDRGGYTKDTNLGYHINEPEGKRLLAGQEPTKDFHDGGGLCSPTHRRGYADGPSWDWLRTRVPETVIKKAGS